MRTNLLLLFLLLGFAIEGSAQIFEKERQEVFNYPCSDLTTLSINNKYGNIQLIAWDKMDSVKIEVAIKVSSSKASKTEKLFSGITIAFNTSPYYIQGETKITYQSKFWNDLSDGMRDIVNEESSANITYTIYLPETLKTSLDNKYGSVYLWNHKGDFQANISNGDFQANNLTGATSLNLRYGKCTINRVQNGTLNLHFITLDLNSADSLVYISKSSESNIKQVRRAEIDVKSDKLTLHNVEQISGKSSFSTINILNAGKTIYLTTRYGEVTVRDYGAEIEQIRFISSSTTLRLLYSRLVSTRLSIYSDERTDLSLATKAIDPERLINTEKDKYENYGSWGAEAPCKVNINANGGAIIYEENL